MYIADCLYMGSEVSIIAKSELVLKTLISSVGDERGNADINVLDIVTDKDVQPVVHGEWIKVYKDRLGNRIFRCSKCDFSYMHNEIFNYCPSCGARMDGE